MMNSEIREVAQPHEIFKEYLGDKEFRGTFADWLEKRKEGTGKPKEETP